MSQLSSYLTCNLVSRRGAVDESFDGPQPQTATCCTALQRGVAADGSLAQPRYAPVRTPASAALLDDDHPTPTTTSSSQQKMMKKQQTTTASRGVGFAHALGGNNNGTKNINNTTTTTSETGKTKNSKPAVRKCKSTMAEAKVSQMMEGPPSLRRSGAVRRDWSFEDLRANNTAA